mgnify:CR=1 FL=1
MPSVTELRRNSARKQIVLPLCRIVFEGQMQTFSFSNFVLQISFLWHLLDNQSFRLFHCSFLVLQSEWLLELGDCPRATPGCCSPGWLANLLHLQPGDFHSKLVRGGLSTTERSGYSEQCSVSPCSCSLWRGWCSFLRRSWPIALFQAAVAMLAQYYHSTNGAPRSYPYRSWMYFQYWKLESGMSHPIVACRFQLCEHFQFLAYWRTYLGERSHYHPRLC